MVAHLPPLRRVRRATGGTTVSPCCNEHQHSDCWDQRAKPCCPDCPAYYFYTGCTEDCPNDCMSDHRGEQ